MGAGFGGFFITVFVFARVTFFIPFFLRAGVRRFAFLDFFATVNLSIGSNKLCQHGTTPQPGRNGYQRHRGVFIGLHHLADDRFHFGR